MKTKTGIIVSIVLFFLFLGAESQTYTKKPLRLGVAGVTHGHASFILGRKPAGDFELVGVFETNKALVQSYAERYGFSPAIIYSDLEKMLDTAKPDAVVAFGSIFDHMAVVEACAPRGIHVMVEKPLATNMAHATRMAELAQKHRIHLLTNYETSWYPTTVKSFHLVNDSNFVGKVRKVVFHHGHQGPKEIGVGKEFMDWLGDPVQNGGGALIDFGCYGANLMTYLLKGETPLSVSAVVKQYKPDLYPKVDDDATIIVDYKTSQGIIQASWNWPFNRKDMEIYGDKGYIFALNNRKMITRNTQSEAEQTRTIEAGETEVFTDPFSYFYGVIIGTIKVPGYGLYSLENNVMVVKILEAARESAKTGTTVRF
jgi:predicted dehydrogenase